MNECTNPVHDHFDRVADLADHAMTWDEAEVTFRDREQVVPFRCHGCGEPAYYDTTADDYRHSAPRHACFLIQSLGGSSPCNPPFFDQAHYDELVGKGFSPI